MSMYANMLTHPHTSTFTQTCSHQHMLRCPLIYMLTHANLFTLPCCLGGEVCSRKGPCQSALCPSVCLSSGVRPVAMETLSPPGLAQGPTPFPPGFLEGGLLGPPGTYRRQAGQERPVGEVFWGFQGFGEWGAPEAGEDPTSSGGQRERGWLLRVAGVPTTPCQACCQTPWHGLCLWVMAPASPPSGTRPHSLPLPVTLEPRSPAMGAAPRTHES